MIDHLFFFSAQNKIACRQDLTELIGQISSVPCRQGHKSERTDAVMALHLPRPPAALGHVIHWMIFTHKRDWKYSKT